MIHNVRVLQTETHGLVMPITDICAEIGYSRSGATRLLERNKDSFVGKTVSESFHTPAGARVNLCLTKEGIDLFIALLCPSETTRPELAERVRQFRAEVFGESRAALINLSRVESSSKGAILPLSTIDPLKDALTRYADRADVLIERWKYLPEVARSLCMAAAVEECPDLVRYRGPAMLPEGKTEEVPALAAPAQDDLPKADPDFEKYYSMEKLSDYCQCEAKQAYKILYDEGVLADMNGHRALTRFGERYAKVFLHMPYFPHRLTVKWMIRYNPEAVQLVRGKLFGTQIPLAEFGRKSPVEPQKTGTGAG